MKKLLAVVAAVAAFSANAESLTVAATPVPHAEILNFVKPQLAKEGVELKVKEFTDYIQPNVQVAEKRLDANFFQHQPYRMSSTRPRARIWSASPAYTEPLGAYRASSRSSTNCRPAPLWSSPTMPPTVAAPCCCWTRPV